MVGRGATLIAAKLKDLAVTVTPPEIEKLLDITRPHFIEDDFKLTWVS